MPTVHINDINMYYETHGDGVPLVLITGLASDLSDFAGIFAGLPQGYRVIALDNRGAGQTDKPDIPYSIQMMADDTAGLLDALDVKRAHILGISMGGRIAVALALRRPDLVRSLILVSTFVRPAPRTLRRFLVLTLMPRLALFRGSRKHPQPYYAFRRQRQASGSFDATSRLGEIQVPTLILHGRSDASAPLRLAEEMHAGIHGSRMVTFPGGHIFFLFRPRPFLAAIQDFLATQTDS